MKQSRKWMRLSGLTALALLCLALLVGLVFTFFKKDPEWKTLSDSAESTDAAAATNGKMPATDSQLTDLTDLSNFRAAYLRANGGREAINGLQSLLVTGTLESNGQTVPFRSIKKRPNQGIFTMSMPEYDLSLVVNGDQAWQRVEKPGMDPVDTLMNKKQARATANLGHFFAPIMHILLDESSAVKRLEADSWEDIPTLRMDYSSSARKMRGAVHFDPKTMTPIARLENFGEGRERLIRYDDYRAIDGGIQQPFLVETFVDGERINRTQIEKVSANPGILNFIFEFRSEADGATASAR